MQPQPHTEASALASPQQLGAAWPPEASLSCQPSSLLGPRAYIDEELTGPKGEAGGCHVWSPGAQELATVVQALHGHQRPTCPQDGGGDHMVGAFVSDPLQILAL